MTRCAVVQMPFRRATQRREQARAATRAEPDLARKVEKVVSPVPSHYPPSPGFSPFPLPVIPFWAFGHWPPGTDRRLLRGVYAARLNTNSHPSDFGFLVPYVHPVVHCGADRLSGVTQASRIALTCRILIGDPRAVTSRPYARYVSDTDRILASSLTSSRAGDDRLDTKQRAAAARTLVHGTADRGAPMTAAQTDPDTQAQAGRSGP